MLIELGILILFLLVGSAIAHETRNFVILGKDTNKIDFVLQPHVAPLFSVRYVSGPPLPETGSLNCEFKDEVVKTPRGDQIHFLAGYCEGGTVVHVIGIDLNH